MTILIFIFHLKTYLGPYVKCQDIELEPLRQIWVLFCQYPGSFPSKFYEFLWQGRGLVYDRVEGQKCTVGSSHLWLFLFQNLQFNPSGILLALTSQYIQKNPTTAHCLHHHHLGPSHHHLSLGWWACLLTVLPASDLATCSIVVYSQNSTQNDPCKTQSRRYFPSPPNLRSLSISE